MGSRFGLNGDDKDVSRLLSSLLSDSVSENIDKIVEKLGKGLDEEVQRRTGTFSKSLDAIYRKQYKQREKDESSLMDKMESRATTMGKQLASGVVDQITKGLTTAVTSVIGTMGKMDLMGNFSQGTNMAAEFRRSYGQLTFGKNSLRDLGSVLTNSFKELKNQGIIVDPKVMYDIYGKLNQVVSLASVSAKQQKDLVVTMTKIAQSGLNVDINTQSGQNIRQIFKATGLEKTVASIGVFTGKFDNFTETMAAAIYNNNDLINSFMIRSRGDQNEFYRFLQNQARVTGSLSSTLGQSNASSLTDVYNKLITGGYGIGQFSSSVFGSNVTKNIRDQYGANIEINKGWASKNPEKIIGAMVNSIQNYLKSYSLDEIMLQLQANPSAFSGVLSPSDFLSIATNLNSGGSAQKVTSDLIKSMGISGGNTNDFYGAEKAKYTSVESLNFESTMAGYFAGAQTYENTVIETLGVGIGLLEEIAGGAVWKTLGQGATQGIFSGAITRGLAAGASGGAPAAGSLLGSLGSGGILVGTLAVGLAAIVDAVKTNKSINEKAGQAGSAALASAFSGTGDWGGVTKSQARDVNGNLITSWANSNFKTYGDANTSLDNAIAYTRQMANGSSYERQSVGGRSGASAMIYALEENKKINSILNGLSSGDRTLAREMYQKYVSEGIIPGQGGSSNERLVKNLHAFVDNFGTLFSLYSSDNYGVGGTTGGNGVSDKLIAELGWITGFFGQPGTFKKPANRFKGKYDISRALATGSDNIPFDGYPALLHQGEMVIPARRANFIRALFGMQTRNASGAYANRRTGENGGVQSIPEYAGGLDMVRFAQAQLGEPYVWGAKGPDSWDCSGLVDGAYQSTFGKRLGKNANGWGKYMIPVSKADSRPGDLVVSNWGPHKTSGVVGWRHVGLVAGNGGTSYLQAKSGKGVIFERDGGTPWSKWGRLPELQNSPAEYFNDSTYATSLIGNGVRGSQTIFGSSGYDMLDKYNLSFIHNLQRKGRVSGTAGAGLGASVDSTNYVKDNSAFNSNKYKGLLTKYANKYGIPPLLLYGIMMAESSGNPYSGRDKNSSYKGLMQVNQGKVDSLFGPGKDIYDPEINIATGANYLKNSAYNKLKYWTLATGGYNHGPNYSAWMNAKMLLDSGMSWSDLVNRVGTTSHMGAGSNSIKTSYIDSVYRRAGLPKAGAFLEKGGIVTEPVNAIIGEGKHDEAVIPLDDEDHFGIDRLRVDVIDTLNIMTNAICKRLDTLIRNQVFGSQGSNIGALMEKQSQARMDSLRGFDYTA